MKKIKLTRDMFVFVDNNTYAFLNQWCWNAHKADDGFYYAARMDEGKFIRMHREIMNAFEYDVVDHIDGNGLNNQKYNLRIVTSQQNSTNRKKANKNNTCGIRNVHKIGKYWRVRLWVNNKHLNFPQKFTTPIDAENFSKEMRNKYYGEFSGK